MKVQLSLFCFLHVWVGFFANAAVDYAREIKPILEEKCYRCHDDEKVKGDLRLDSPEGILAGGKGGGVLVPGKANESALFVLTTYPQDDPDYMPQKGKGLSQSEQALLKTWIDEGALFSKGFVHRQNPVVRSKFAGTDPDSMRNYMILGEALEIVKQLREAGLLVDTVNHDSSRFEVSYTHANRRPGEFNLTELVPLEDTLKRLTLARTEVASEDLKALTELASIEHLDLSRTDVGDQALNFVSQLTGLKTLNLRDTNVTDEGLQKLVKLEKLELVYVWGSIVTASGAKWLEKQIDGVTVKVGTPVVPPNRGRNPRS